MLHSGRPLFGLQTGGRAQVDRVAGSPASLSGFDARYFVNVQPPESAGDRPHFQMNEGEASRIRTEMRAAYERGELLTMSWHMADPVSGGSYDSYQQSLRSGDAARRPRVAEVLRAGSPAREAFIEQLDQFAQFANSLRDSSGNLIPFVFRPFHEQNGSWFWWGADHCTPEEYRDLYRLTIDHLRSTRNLHQLLIAWSPSERGGDTTSSYYRGYPGDTSIDIFGLDAYQGFDFPDTVERTGRQIRWLTEQARAHGKLSALTEVGALGDSVDRSAWYQDRLGRALRMGGGRSLSYIMAWRNNSLTGPGREGCFPEPGTTAESVDRMNDFNSFRSDHEVTLLNDLKSSIYRAPRLQSTVCGGSRE
jgi:mannan endo-1,4-beta-mannosidase